MSGTVSLLRAVELGREMRIKQEAYFRLRTRESLIAAKQAERTFDRVAGEALRVHDEEQQATR